ncbi:calcium-binding protein [Nocardioides sp.]|uniref:calcium-binding protein n=1 Tax=Nocardioides sp. TaxID=35761 RepID=UPI003516F719
MKGLAVLDRTERGYRFRAGQQDSDLRVSLLGGRLVIADRGTAAWRGLPAGCRRLSPPVGIAAACPARSRQREVFLEIWPRLGDDVVDTTALPARYRAWVLTDDGDDVVRTGAGDDFVNGAQGDDVVDTGSGQDWVRGGIGANTIAGGEDGDRLVGGEDVDVLDGGAGDDVLFGAGGADELTGADGADLLVGEDGPDTARADDHDVVRTCERIVADEAATPAPRGAPRRIARADLR